MKRTFPFLKTTLTGGLLVLLPLWLMVLLVVKAVGFIKSLTAPIVARLPKELDHPTAIALLLLLAVCFLVGLLMRTTIGRHGGDMIESHFLNRVPGYTFFRNLTHRFLGKEGEGAFAVCLAAIGDTLVPAFLVEEHEDTECTIFVPSAPTPGMGAIHIIPKERVHLINVPLSYAVACVTRWGKGSSKLVRAMCEAERRNETSAIQAGTLN